MPILPAAYTKSLIQPPQPIPVLLNPASHSFWTKSGDSITVVQDLRRGLALTLTYRGQPLARLEPIYPSAEDIAADDPLYRLAEQAEVAEADERLAMENGTRLVAVDRSRLDLEAAPPFNGLVQSEDQRASGHEGSDQQPQQNIGNLSRRPACPAQRTMLVLKTMVRRRFHSTQSGGQNVVSRGD